MKKGKGLGGWKKYLFYYFISFLSFSFFFSSSLLCYNNLYLFIFDIAYNLGYSKARPVDYYQRKKGNY